MPKLPHPILSPAEAVVARARNVHISAQAIRALTGDLIGQRDSERSNPQHWLSTAPDPVKEHIRLLSVEEAGMFLLVFHAAGFSYWQDPEWKIRDSDGTIYNGSAAWLICLCRQPEMIKPAFMATLTPSIWFKLIAGENDIAMPMAGARLEILQRTGSTLDQTREIGTRIGQLITGSGESNETDAVQTAFWLSENLPGFADTSNYNELRVPFLKRAQLLTNDWNYLRRQNAAPQFAGIEKLTAFADYKIPQLLRLKSVLEYSSDLASKIDSKIELIEGSGEEIEIRAATVVAVERIREELAGRGRISTPAEIDNLLWSETQGVATGASKMAPYHRCRTIHY